MAEKAICFTSWRSEFLLMSTLPVYTFRVWDRFRQSTDSHSWRRAIAEDWMSLNRGGYPEFRNEVGSGGRDLPEDLAQVRCFFIVGPPDSPAAEGRPQCLDFLRRTK